MQIYDFAGVACVAQPGGKAEQDRVTKGLRIVMSVDYQNSHERSGLG